MRKQILALTFSLFALFLTGGLYAQIQTPAASPGAKLETTVGLTDVTVEYSRPGIKGRTIFAADGLVPFGEIWRTGANQATKFTFGTKVMLGGQEVPAGSYAVLSKPMAKSWEIMFFPYESGSWNSYVEKEPALTLTAETMSVPGKVENFTIMFDEYTMDGANIYMMWDQTMVAVPLKTNAKEAVMANIDRTMAGPSVNDYFGAASFLSDSEADMDKALTYIQKANEMTKEEPRFWMVRREAVILGQMGKTQDAIAKAKESLELAKKAGNMDYVRMNEKSIKEWMKK